MWPDLSNMDETEQVSKNTKAKKKSSFLSLKTMGRQSLVVLLEVIVVGVLLCSLAAGGMIWRLKSGPVDIDFARESIELALRDENTGAHTKVGDVAVFWPDMSGPIFFGLKDAKIFNGRDEEIADIDELLIGVSKRYLMLGRIVPVAVVLKQPRLHVVRNKDSLLDFGFNFEKTAENIGDTKSQEQTDLIERALQFIATPGTQAQTNSPLARLRSFDIENAGLKFTDLKHDVIWDTPDFSLSFEAGEQGLLADMAFSIRMAGEERRAQFQADAIVDWRTKTSTFNAVLDGFDIAYLGNKAPSLSVLQDQSAVVDAVIQGRLDRDLMPLSLDVDFGAPKGQILVAELSDDPIDFKDLNIRFEYEPERLRVHKAEITAKDVTLKAKADLQKTILDMGFQWGGAAALSLNDIPQSAIAPLWPKGLDEEIAKEWIVEKLSNGTLSDLAVKTDVSFQNIQDEWSVDLSGLIASFAFDDMDIQYKSTLPPVTNASGTGVFNLDKEGLSVTVSRAKMLDMDVPSAQLEFMTIIEKGKGRADLDINLSGPLSNVFTFLTHEPIALKEALEFDIDAVKGHADMRIHLDFPTSRDLKVEQIEMDISSTVTEASIPGLVKGMDLSGGPYQVQVDNEKYAVKGSGQLAGRPVELEWDEFFKSKDKPYKNKAIASIVADPNLRRQLGVDLSDFVEGSVPISLVYKAYQDNRAQIELSMDLKPATLKLDAMAYNKAPGQEAKGDAIVDLVAGNLKAVRNLSITGPDLVVKNAALGFSGAGKNVAFRKANIEHITVGQTTGTAELEQEPGGPMKIVFNGALLDLRPFLANDTDKSEHDSDAMIISVTANQMRASDNAVVEAGKLYIDIDDKGRFNQLEMDAVAGGGDIYMRYKPDDTGVRTFRLEADNAGAALKAFQIYDKIKGGKLVIYGEPISNIYDRNLVGVVEMSDFKVMKAPSLAKLLGAMSLPGVIELLDGEGVSFAKMEAKFDWLYRPRGGLLVLKDGRTSGNSLGLTFDGVFDKLSSSVDVSGTIIPLSGLNQFLGNIPLLGTVLTGGSGTLFAATYTMKGQAVNPEVSVNPLSVLAPGILRRILFE